MITVKTSNHEITLTDLPESFQATLTTTQVTEGVDLVHITFSAPQPVLPSECTLAWTHPIMDIHSLWRTTGDHDRSLPPSWLGRFTPKTTSQAPIFSLQSLHGQNRLTCAFSDALNAVRVRATVQEDIAVFQCSLTLFVEPSPPISHYEATLRLDTRDLPYYTCLDEVQQWWAALPGYEPAPVPEIARLPMYSTWYSFHKQVTDKDVEEQCRLAKELGCEAVIMDDGWQTSNNAGIYAYTGDWEVAPDKIPDMKEHVARVHALGMKYLLWYSVPFVGVKSKAYTLFADKLLYTDESMGTGVLDPRFVAVREYLINTYELAMIAWDLDGFKLDFVDVFGLPEGKTELPGESFARDVALLDGQDYLSVPAAVDRLLTDIIARLRQIKPDVMVEFRQPYIGPLMRKYGNMFRAGDCPHDAITNRERTIDVRLLCGNTAAHADMLTWHRDEPVESAALQIINILFSVPQISVLLHTLPPQHLAMVRYWLSFWREHRDVLLDGRLMPLHPETFYPIVYASRLEKRIAVMYQETIVSPGPQLPDSFVVVNGTRQDGVVLEFPVASSSWQLEIRDCQGQVCSYEREVVYEEGLRRFAVPAAGVLTLHRR